MCSEQTRFSVSCKSLGDGVSRRDKNTISSTLLEETLPTIASSSRDPFTEYPEDYNVQTENYMKLILRFLNAHWQEDWA